MSQSNVISWSKDYLLHWSDFQAEYNPAAYEDAHSTIKYRCVWTVNSDNIGKQILFFIENVDLITEFYPSLSWVRPSCQTIELLNHEQGKFDLVESFRDKIKKELMNIFQDKKFLTRGQNSEQRKQFAREDSGLMIRKEIEKWEQYVLKKQEEYDHETNYGQIVEKQQEYDDLFIKLRNEV